MTIPEALKELYVALGGSADDVANMSTNPELIAKIATVAGGGSGLPEVTAEDNGDVLAVINGAWGKATPQRISVYKASEQASSGMTTVSLSDGKKTSDLAADFDNGKIVFVITLNHTFFISDKFTSGGIKRYILSSTGYEIPSGDTQARPFIYRASIQSQNEGSFLLEKYRLALYSDIPTT